jgi:hypothetical protein
MDGSLSRAARGRAALPLDRPALHLPVPGVHRRADRWTGRVGPALAGCSGRNAMTRNAGRSLVAAALLAAVTLAGGGAPPAAAIGFVQVTYDPSPPVGNGPLEVQASFDGCPANTMVEVTLWFENWAGGDVIFVEPMASASTITDGSGAGAATLSVPVAYPGAWLVGVKAGDELCAEGIRERIDFPVGGRLVVTPTSPAVGSTVTVTGGGCFGDRVDAGIPTAPSFGFIVDGSTVPDASGRGSIDLVVPATGELSEEPDLRVVRARCHYTDPDLAVGDDLFAVYASVRFTVASPTTSSTTTSMTTSSTTAVRPVSVTPRFTG